MSWWRKGEGLGGLRKGRGGGRGERKWRKAVSKCEGEGWTKGGRRECRGGGLRGKGEALVEFNGFEECGRKVNNGRKGE